MTPDDIAKISLALDGLAVGLLFVCIWGLILFDLRDG